MQGSKHCFYLTCKRLLRSKTGMLVTDLTVAIDEEDHPGIGVHPKAAQRLLDLPELLLIHDHIGAGCP